MNQVTESKHKLTFILDYTELNFKFYNNEYFLNKGINAKVFIVIKEDGFKGGDNSLIKKNNLSLTIPYRYFFDYSNYIQSYFYNNNNVGNTMSTIHTKNQNLFMDIMNRITILGKYIGNYTEKILGDNKTKEESKKEELNYPTIENIQSNIQEFKPIEIKDKQKMSDETGAKDKVEDGFHLKTNEPSGYEEVENKKSEEEFILKPEDKQIFAIEPNKKLKIEIINISKYSRITEDEEAVNYIKMYKIFKEKKGKIYIGEVYHYMVDGEVIVIGNIEKECEGLCNMEFEEEELKEIENTLFYKEIKYYLE